MAPTTSIKTTRSRKALNAANLEALGPAQLAAILLAVADEQPIAKRRLRLELAAAVGVEDLSAELEKHMDAVAAATSRVHWRRIKALRQELDLTKAMIVARLAIADPAAGLRLLLRLLGLERGLQARLSDRKGEITSLFADAVSDLTLVAAAAPEQASTWDGAVFAALEQARFGAMGEITRAMIPALGPAGVAALRARIETEMAPRRRVNAGWRDALQVLLDAQGDAAAYAATYSPSESVLPPIGARIADRFLLAGQIAEAEQALARSDPHANTGEKRAASVHPPARGAPAPDPGLLAWEAVWIDLLEAKGDGVAAQAARWAAFERDLSPEPLRAHLRRLSDFDDVVAADRAMDHARTFPDFSRALGFLIAWPALSEAAGLVLTRAAEIDGLAIETLEPAARALEGRHPLAATLLLRAMVGDVLKFSQAQFYQRASGWLDEAAALEARISDFQGHEDHAAFERRLRGLIARVL